MKWDKRYLDWCEIMNQDKNVRDQMIFMAGATSNSILEDDNKDVRSEADKEVTYEKFSIDDFSRLDWMYRVDLVRDKIIDQEILKEIVLKDDDKSVRGEAAKKITDEEFVVDNFSRLGWVRCLYIVRDNIKDQELLKKIVLNDRDSDVRGEAAKKITDEKFIIDNFSNLCFKIKECLIRDKITDQDFLKKISLEYDEEDIREEAVKKITDINFIIENFLKFDWRIRMELVRDKIADKKFLKKIAIEDNNKYVREEASKKITIIRS